MVLHHPAKVTGRKAYQSSSLCATAKFNGILREWSIDLTFNIPFLYTEYMYIRKPNVKCSVCETPIYRRLSKLKNGLAYCSQKCYGFSCRKPVSCVICGKEILAGLHKKTCSKKCKLENDKSVNRIHSLGRKKSEKVKWGTRSFRTRFLEERGTKCEECSYSKTEVLQIHHVIERSNGGSDDFSNLKLLCRNCHGEVHLGLREL